MNTQQEQGIRLAVLSAVAAYIMWGCFGLYFKALDSVSALEILCHRVVWSVILLLGIILYSGKWAYARDILFNPRKLAIYALSALLIATNWGFYIYAVISGQALEGSMGYFIMPLVAVVLGGVFFGEKFSKTQVIAILFAFLGVAYQLWALGKLPWIALILAFSFGFYGMLRKKAPADSVVGLFLETALITPFALIYMVYLGTQGNLQLISAPLELSLLMVMAGPVTAIPLIMFAYGARKLRYSTAGLLQYINPTCQFLVALFVFNEAFEYHKLITFAFIWAGLVLYSLNSLQQSRVRKSTIA